MKNRLCMLLALLLGTTNLFGAADAPTASPEEIAGVKAMLEAAQAKATQLETGTSIIIEDGEIKDNIIEAKQSLKILTTPSSFFAAWTPEEAYYTPSSISGTGIIQEGLAKGVHISFLAATIYLAQHDKEISDDLFQQKAAELIFEKSVIAQSSTLKTLDNKIILYTLQLNQAGKEYLRNRFSQLEGNQKTTLELAKLFIELDIIPNDRSNSTTQKFLKLWIQFKGNTPNKTVEKTPELMELLKSESTEELEDEEPKNEGREEEEPNSTDNNAWLAPYRNFVTQNTAAINELNAHSAQLAPANDDYTEDFNRSYRAFHEHVVNINRALEDLANLEQEVAPARAGSSETPESRVKQYLTQAYLGEAQELYANTLRIHLKEQADREDRQKAEDERASIAEAERLAAEEARQKAAQEEQEARDRELAGELEQEEQIPQPTQAPKAPQPAPAQTELDRLTKELADAKREKEALDALSAAAEENEKAEFDPLFNEINAKIARLQGEIQRHTAIINTTAHTIRTDLWHEIRSGKKLSASEAQLLIDFANMRGTTDEERAKQRAAHQIIMSKPDAISNVKDQAVVDAWNRITRR